MNLPDTLAENIAARFAQLDRIEQELGAVAGRLSRLEQKVAALGEPVAKTSADAEARLARMEAELLRTGKQLEEYAAALESSRAAGAQTDDLVERVVEAIESLQATALDPSGSSAAGAN
jgi:uncharacterized coiled-coil protein SlyX